MKTARQIRAIQFINYSLSFFQDILFIDFIPNYNTGRKQTLINRFNNPIGSYLVGSCTIFTT
ncbi:hypothetical protein SAMN05660349_02306 [Macellibacteroides fermentans]|uniref:Uncharacterized protein n=1 Tax=Parabacteroides chartae TaxID=1037355 RepID=A0A1T5D8X8_9BACT|nr:hypothetical protein SAMN05660349_02306 [Parabacteroides chartae]